MDNGERFEGDKIVQDGATGLITLVLMPSMIPIGLFKSRVHVPNIGGLFCVLQVVVLEFEDEFVETVSILKFSFLFDVDVLKLCDSEA